MMPPRSTGAAAAVVLGSAVMLTAVGLVPAACRATAPVLPDGGGGLAAPASATQPRPEPAATPPPDTPPPDDAHAAAQDVDPDRAVSPAQGVTRLTVRATRPAGGAPAQAYQAYLGWVRAYLDAFARPGVDSRALDRYATPAVAQAVRQQAAALAARGWAEYGTATLVSVAARVAPAGARVDACLDLSGLATRDASGRLAGRDRAVRSTATLVVSAGRWQVSADEKAPVTRCA